MTGLGFGFNAFQVTELIRPYLFKTNITISDSWVFGFLERHPEISKRRAQSLEKERLGALNENTIHNYFLLLQKGFKICKDLSNGKDLTPGRVFAADEVGFSNDNTHKYILAKKGEKHPFVVNPKMSQHVSIMAFAAANGWIGAEYFLLPEVRQRPAFNAEMKKYFPEAEVDMTPKGYMTEGSFVNWVKFFLKSINEIRGDNLLWCLLIGTGNVLRKTLRKVAKPYNFS